MRLLMNRIVLPLLILIVAGAAPHCRADGLLYQLPEDGTKAVFDLKIETRGMEGTGTLTMSSVGKVTEDGKACRWIEFALDVKFGERAHKTVAKVLIPESEMTAGKKPFENRVRGWVRLNEGQESVKLEQANFGPVPAFLAGPFEDSKKLEEAEVDSPSLGKVKCAGVSGTLTYEDRRKNVVAMETRLHKTAAFGVVSSKMDVKVERNGELAQDVVITLALKSVGKDAKSELPDSN